MATSALPQATSDSWTRHTIDASSRGADGLSDLVTSWEQGGITRIYLAANQGSARPTWTPITVGTSRDAEDALFFDADGDGSLDIVSSTEGDERRLLIHWAPPRDRYEQESEWRTETLFADGSRWMFAVPMDVDGRFGTDLVVGGKDEGSSIGWLESPAKPRHVRDWKFHRVSDVGWTMSLVVRDMNGDGIADILCSDRYGPMAGLRWLENPGPDATQLRSPWRNHWIGARGRQAMFLDVADVDGDGTAEIVLPHQAGTDYRLSIFRRRGGAASQEWEDHQIPYPSIVGTPKAAAVGDIDLDGRQDIVLSTANARGGKRGVVWLRGHSSPFDAPWDAFDISGPEGIKFDLNLLLDVDRDGDLDVVNSEENDNAAGGPGLGVVWYENPTRVQGAPRK